MQQATRGCNVGRDTSLRLSSFRETTLYRRCPRNDVGSPRHYGVTLFRATSLQGDAGAAHWCTGMQTRPSARDPDRVPLDLFAVNEIKGPIIEFFGKLLPLRPGSGLFSHETRFPGVLTLDLTLPHVSSPVNQQTIREKEIV